MEQTSGSIYYGMHFYPGLAQYDENPQRPIKIFLNETVLRKMDPTFAGKPIFVEHVEEVDPRLDEVRKEADGWVVESFFNDSDGKHWVKMVIVSEKGTRAIKNGFKLSNAYLPRLSGKGGLWNNIPYDDEVVDGEYEHLAIVSNPRYAESVILTPEEFKAHNENLKIELDRISNSKEESFFMKLKFWNRKPVENSTDFENIFVTLPKSGKEFSIAKLVNEMDEQEEKKKENMHESGHPMAEKGHMVKLHDGTMCNVGELVKKYGSLHEDSMKNKKEEEEGGLDLDKQEMDVEGDLHNEGEEEDKAAKKKALELAEHEDKEIKEEKGKMENTVSAPKTSHFNTLKNAPLKVKNEEEIELSIDRVERGKSRYGSN